MYIYYSSAFEYEHMDRVCYLVSNVFYNYLIDKGVDPKKIPVYTPPNNKNRKTNAQNNEQVITGGYQQDGTSTGKFGRETRNNRLLKKGRALRNWFSPLRGN